MMVACKIEECKDNVCGRCNNSILIIDEKGRCPWGSKKDRKRGLRSNRGPIDDAMDEETRILFQNEVSNPLFQNEASNPVIRNQEGNIITYIPEENENGRNTTKDRLVIMDTDEYEVYLEFPKQQEIINTQRREIANLQEKLNFIENSLKTDFCGVPCDFMEEVANKQAKNAIKELVENLEDHIALYREHGKSLDVYRWLQNYIKDVLGEE